MNWTQLQDPDNQIVHTGCKYLPSSVVWQFERNPPNALGVCCHFTNAECIIALQSGVFLYSISHEDLKIRWCLQREVKNHILIPLLCTFVWDGNLLSFIIGSLRLITNFMIISFNSSSFCLANDSCCCHRRVRASSCFCRKSSASSSRTLVLRVPRFHFSQTRAKFSTFLSRDWKSREIDSRVSLSVLRSKSSLRWGSISMKHMSCIFTRSLSSKTFEVN